MNNIRTAIGSAILMGLTTTAALADSITPGSFSTTLSVGQSTTIHKTVTIDASSAAKVDVFFLADTTGSMSGSITGIINSASSILSTASGLGDVAFGVGEYKDSRDRYRYRLNQDITSDLTAAQNGINLWRASGGYDFPEANLFALERAATTTSWRAGSERILVWFGDAPGHNPDGGSTLASATAALTGAGIQVEAIDVGSSSVGLDHCTISGYCSASSEGGAASSGQATAITNATGGNLHTSTNSSAIVSVINNAINAAIQNYTEVGLDLSAVPVGVSVVSTPASYSGSWDRSVSRSFGFDVTITGDTAGVYDFNIYGTVDGGRIGTEVDHIVVTSSVPEPGMLGLMGLSLAGLGLVRRRRLG